MSHLNGKIVASNLMACRPKALSLYAKIGFYWPTVYGFLKFIDLTNRIVDEKIQNNIQNCIELGSLCNGFLRLSFK